ncbi:penicillin-binding transpeptidase domain-containing protein, partial [Pantoea sp. SIMBA_133]
PNTTLVDEVLYFKDEGKKSSYTANAMGPISDLVALQRSSNVYMWKIAMSMADYDYAPYESSGYDPAAYDELKESFSQFGLGVKTGIDLPG